MKKIDCPKKIRWTHLRCQLLLANGKNPFIEDNTVPSLRRKSFKGVTTKTYDRVGYEVCKRVPNLWSAVPRAIWWRDSLNYIVIYRITNLMRSFSSLMIRIRNLSAKMAQAITRQFLLALLLSMKLPRIWLTSMLLLKSMKIMVSLK